MTTEKKLEILISFLENNGITVKSDRGDFKGGMVRYHDDKFLYLNRKLDSESRIKLIIEEIKEMQLNPDVFDDTVSEIIRSDTEK
ncbi:MAG: hypothetical protein KDF60_07725 [Calditrichaeota bacterium]|nr:hypothetical protein [Calditrichota bacterium]